MEEFRSKRTTDPVREKSGKKSVQEKKAASDTTIFNANSSVRIPSIENFIVIGKGCSYGKSKPHDSGYRLHECFSETDISPLQVNSKNFSDFIQSEELQNVASNSSFVSAKSSFSEALQKKIHDLEDALGQQMVVISSLKKQIGDKKMIEVNSVSTETDLSLIAIEEERFKLKTLEKKVSCKEKKIKELKQNLEECSIAKDSHVEENKVLKNQVNLLSRQIQSLFDLLKKKNWTTIDPTEFAKCKNKLTELETLVASQEQEKNELYKKIKIISTDLQSKEKELNAKCRELVDYKNRSTLEMCKLINQIDCLQKEAKSQTQFLDSKISEAQNFMDEEIVDITYKLEEQYQKDVKSAVERFHADFERLADLPKTAIEKLLRFCESDKVDFISYQKEWDKQQKMLEAKIESLEVDRFRETTQLKDNYETKIVFLKTQIEALLSQLKERKDIIDVFENELMMYKTNSAMNLLKASSLGDDISALKELYTAEIFSQKQVHKLEVNIFEEKVKTLTDEILYHAKNEEIHLQELENAKNIAFAFREKYEKLVSDWEEKAEKDYRNAPINSQTSPELDSLILEVQDLIQSIKKSEQVHEEIIQKAAQNEEEKICLLHDIQDLKKKLQALKNFQKMQAKLDETISSLVEVVGINYSKTVDTFLLSHATELSLKQMEICASERRHIAEIDALKKGHAKELEELRNKAECSENAKNLAENEVASLKKTKDFEKLEELKMKMKEISMNLIKSEGIIVMKEETERTLNEKIEELEKIIRLKEENCQKEMEDLTAKYLKEKVLSSAKDELTKELEDELNKSESILNKSYEAVDRLIGLCSTLENISKIPNDDVRHYKPSQEFRNKFLEAKVNIEHLKATFLETFEKIKIFEKIKSENDDFLKMRETLETELKLSLEKNSTLEKERNSISEENSKMKKQINNLAEEITNKEKTLMKIELMEEELGKMSELRNKLKMLELEKEKIADEEKKEILERNEFLEGTVKDLNEQIDQLATELESSKASDRQEVFSVILQEVRFLYAEEEDTASTSTVACQAELFIPGMKKKNANLGSETEGEVETDPLYEEIISKYKSIQKDLIIAIQERNELLMILKNLEKEKDKLKEDLESLQEENYMICAQYQCEIKVLAEKELCFDDSGRAEMNREIGRLNEHIKTLSNKLDIMKASNELLLSESQEHFRLNQNLVSELEEAWSQRYEIEDQLAQVRRENALLNLHRRQLEETNKKISNLVAEGQPSIASWIKIHETVETIVDEVLALKTSFSDSCSISGSGTSAGFDLPRANPELKLMTDNLRTQLKSKTTLCEELIIQKEALQKELRTLEDFFIENDSKSLCFRKKVESCSGRKKNRQPILSSSVKLQDFDSESRSLSEGSQSDEASHVMILKTLKKHLENESELEETQSRESLEFEVEKLKKKIQNGYSEDDDSECLKSMELKYEKEVSQLTTEFEKEVEKLKQAFQSEEKDSWEIREVEIEKVKKYFEKRWSDLEKKYAEICSIRKRKRLISSPAPELQHILEQLNQILLEENNEEKKKLKIENLFKSILIQRDNEVKSVQEKYKEVVAMLEKKHAIEMHKLQSVVHQLKENIMLALKKETEESLLKKTNGKYQDLIIAIRSEYETKLEDERKKHEKEIVDLEEFWTEKLSDCETKCAIMRATGGMKTKSQEEFEDSLNHEISENKRSVRNLTDSEEKATEEKQTITHTKTSNSDVVKSKIGKSNHRNSLCISCLANHSFFKRMELKTDDDKLDVIQRRDSLEEMIFSMRNIIIKLLTYIGHHRSELSSTSIDIDETLYKSIHFDVDRTSSDMSMISNSVLLTVDLPTLFQEIKDNSLPNSSDLNRIELEKCLKQLKNDANGLFALSCGEKAEQNLSELVKKITREKNGLEEKVLKVEEIQNEMKKEINLTKDRLSQWERTLEVISEGYGEEIVEPKQTVSLLDIKDKLKMISKENCGHSLQDVNLLEELCKEGDRLQEEWMKEKCDLQQQIDVADKQVHSLRKFLEEQAVEREQEREAFDREINKLQESLKAKERNSTYQSRTSREVGCLSIMSLADNSVEALINQVKDLNAQLIEAEKNKEVVEGEFQNAVKKIWSLREVIQDLESQLAEVSERESNLKKKLEKLDGLLEEHSKVNRNLEDELEACRDQNEVKYSEHIKSLEEELTRLRHLADQVNAESITQLKADLRQIETVLVKKTKDLEQLYVSSANVSCSSPSEDVSIRDQIDATRCSTPDEMCSKGQSLSMFLPLQEIDRVHEMLVRHSRAEEVAMKYIQDLKMQLRNHQKVLEEVQTERDVLLEKADLYLKENSSLKVRLEEQRCNAGLLQKQLNANLESQINRLEVDVEKLNELCNEKDKQLQDMKVMLENTTKSLKIRETEVSNKSKEENTLITSLKTDLANALNENEKLEEKLEKAKEKLRETLKMPALIDTMLEEKNAEIDRLEKEVARLSTEKTTSGVTSRSFNSEEKQKRKIRFSEPESFSENISSISVQCLSDLRSCSESCADFRNSSFKSRRPIGSSTKLESISSIAPLQLSPRGTDSSFNWKTSSPILENQTTNQSPLKTTPAKPDISQLEEMAKLQREIETKQREISELHLEIDILKRQLVETNQKVATAKSESKDLQNDLTVKDEEIRKLKNNEKNLLMTIDSIKKNHAEEVDVLQNQLSFEHRKAEKVYEEIKALEVKKIEIEESFLSLKEDYNEKINGEKKTAEGLMHRIKVLETRNNESELRLRSLEKELENTVRESEKAIETLSREILELKAENDNIRLAVSQKKDAETQVEEEACICQKSLTFEMPEAEEGVVPTLEELKAEFDKMAAVIGQRDFDKKEAFLYAMAVRRLLSVVLNRVEELSRQVEAHMKKVMECSVDDLAVKVQKELVLSAKLDNQLLSSIEANGFSSKETIPQPDYFDCSESSYKETGGGDNKFIVPKPLGNTATLKVVNLYKDVTKRISELEKERESLEGKVSEQQKIIKLLEDGLKKEKERILEEKERCSEDAKIMELLRVNLEKRLVDIKAKEKELKKEKFQRMALEKELEDFKKQETNVWENKKFIELNAMLESEKEKLASMRLMLEEEKKINQDLRLSLEEEKIERMAVKNAQKLMESDLGLLRDQKESFKKELLNVRKLLHSRNVEIGLLKRKINLQEIDMKALSISASIHNPNSSEVSSLASDAGSPTHLPLADSPFSLLLKMRKLNSCVQRHVKESTEMGEALLYLSQETEQMKDIIRKLEESNETKLADETLVSDAEVERRLWALEKGRLVMDLETLKRENEVLKHDLVDTCKSNDALKQENCKLKKEIRSPKKEEAATNQIENGFLHERVSHLTKKFMRTESYRKALAWQKQYLLITLQEYQRSEEEAWRRIGRRKRDGKRKGQKSCWKFRVVALAAVAIFRMKFIVKRWQKNALNHIFSSMETKAGKLKLAPPQSVLNNYNEPVNPLSYQTQHIFRPSLSQVLRTPPSRDPGPRGFSFDPKNFLDRRES